MTLASLEMALNPAGTSDEDRAVARVGRDEGQGSQVGRDEGQGSQVCQSGIPGSSAQGYDPSLKLQGDTIPFIGDSTFRFLGAPITIHDATADQRGVPFC